MLSSSKYEGEGGGLQGRWRARRTRGSLKMVAMTVPSVTTMWRE
jgi:hypothetical protein